MTQALTFAFATGDSTGLLDQVIAKPNFGGLSWQSKGFADSIFLRDLIEQQLLTDQRNERWGLPFLLRLLSRPPHDLATVRWRQDALSELVTDGQVAQDFRATFADLCRLRGLLVEGALGAGQHAIRRRLEILGQIKTCIDGMATRFAGSNTAFANLRRLGESYRQEPAYRTLADLLDFHDNAAVIGARLTVSLDGTLRQLELLSHEENADNPHHLSTVQRLWRRFSMWVRGYRLNHSELLGTLVERAYQGVEGWLVSLIHLLCDALVYHATLRFHRLCVERQLPVCLANIDSADVRSRLHFERLYNPLLFSQTLRPVCTDIDSRAGNMTIITGPNSGGKTRLLQAVGLAQLLGQSGLFVPAHSAHVPLARSMSASFGAAGTADQKEGHLGTELLRIRELFEGLTPGALVLVDELCSGTNPAEGEEIFRLVLEVLSEAIPHAFITTHFLRFASELEQQRPCAGLQFLQVELDREQEPTYRFVPGVAQTSLAGKTAQRLGITRSRLQRMIAQNRERLADEQSFESASAPATPSESVSPRDS